MEGVGEQTKVDWLDLLINAIETMTSRSTVSESVPGAENLVRGPPMRTQVSGYATTAGQSSKRSLVPQATRARQ
jgi:hypothetical protein